MIKKLYEKSEICFAVAWIIAYCVLASTGDNMSVSVGVMKSVTLPILIILSVILYLFVKKNGLTEKYGLCKSKISASKMLFYLPILILFTVNLWYGVVLNATPLETVLYVLSMLCVGFLEEMIFRGLLFKAMEKDGLRTAIIVSSVSFGMGHIVNLINGSGAELLQTILQIFYAIAVGFMLVMIFYKTKSMLVCIAMHSIFNALSAFGNEAAMTVQNRIISSLFIIIIAGGYALYITLMVEDKETFRKISIYPTCLGVQDMEYEIVMATEADRDEILSLYKAQLGRECCPWNEDYPSNEEIDWDLSRDALFVLRRNGSIRAAVSIEEDEAVDCLSCWDENLAPVGELARLAVLPEEQSKGLGRIMLKFGMEELKRRGFNGIHFLVNKNNSKAIRCYSVFGFRVVGECHMYEQDFLCYEKELLDREVL